MKQGKVALVGAGPGDPGLVTKKGWQCIQEADVIVYDALVCPSVLNAAKPDCQLIFAGKQAGHHFKKQKEINLMLAQLAAEGNYVVRLKGGDPFIFGRGGEEGQALKKHNIAFEIVPGVSSCYSVPAYAGIPVTHRSYASAFHVITGHKQLDHQLDLDYNSLANLDGTLIFLMSLMNLPHIAKELIIHGKSPDIPTAVIQEGTTARQRTVIATLGTIAEAVKEQNISTPSMIVIGEVVALRDELQWFETGVLFGKHIVITGTPHYNQKLAKKLRQFGPQVTELSLIQIKENSPYQLKHIKWENYQWLVFTSANGVELFFRQILQSNIDFRQILPCKFAAIGNGTAYALKKHGIFADCIPEKFNSKHLAQALIPMLSDTDHVLLLRAENGSVVLPDLLQEAGIAVDTVPLYRTKPDLRKKELLSMVLQNADYLVFSSASAVQAYRTMADPNQFHGKILSIGSVTTVAAEQCGIPIAETAKRSDIDGVVHCLLENAMQSKED